MFAVLHSKNLVTTSESHRRIYSFLKAYPYGVLATVDPNGNPHGTVVYFAVDEAFNITFTTKRDTKKHDNLQHDNHTMLVAFDPSSQTTVQVIGKAYDISDDLEANQAFQNTLDASAATSEAGMPPISKLYAGNYVAYKIRPKQIRMAVFARPDPGGYDIYETVDF